MLDIWNQNNKESCDTLETNKLIVAEAFVSQAYFIRCNLFLVFLSFYRFRKVSHINFDRLKGAIGFFPFI